MLELNERLRDAAKVGDEVEQRVWDEGVDVGGVAWRGHEECVRILLPESEPSGKDEDGITALMHAASDGHTQCARLLLPVSALGVRNDEAMTASEYAMNKGRPEIADIVDADVLAQTELSALSSLTVLGPPCKTPSRRV